MTGRSWTIRAVTGSKPLLRFRCAVWCCIQCAIPMTSATDFAPMDFVLGWGPMSDQARSINSSFEQRMRAYAWSQLDAKNPVPNGEITCAQCQHAHDPWR